MFSSFPQKRRMAFSIISKERTFGETPGKIKVIEITNIGFKDSGSFVKIYFPIKSNCEYGNSDVNVDVKPWSFKLMLKSPRGPVMVFNCPNLAHEVQPEESQITIKEDKIVLKLWKCAKDLQWEQLLESKETRKTEVEFMLRECLNVANTKWDQKFDVNEIFVTTRNDAMQFTFLEDKEVLQLMRSSNSMATFNLFKKIYRKSLSQSKIENYLTVCEKKMRRRFDVGLCHCLYFLLDQKYDLRQCDVEETKLFQLHSSENRWPIPDVVQLAKSALEAGDFDSAEMNFKLSVCSARGLLLVTQLKEELTKAEEATDRKDFKEALNCYRKICAQTPRAAEFGVELIRLLLLNHHFVEAKQLIGSKPETSLEFVLGQTLYAYYTADLFVLGENMKRALLSRHSHNASVRHFHETYSQFEGLNCLMGIHYNINQYDKSFSFAQRALLIDPDNAAMMASLHSKLAVYYQLYGSPAHAWCHYEMYKALMDELKLTDGDFSSFEWIKMTDTMRNNFCINYLAVVSNVNRFGRQN